MCEDFLRAGHARMIVDPGVRQAYFPETARALYTDKARAWCRIVCDTFEMHISVHAQLISTMHSPALERTICQCALHSHGAIVPALPFCRHCNNSSPNKLLCPGSAAAPGGHCMQRVRILAHAAAGGLHPSDGLGGCGGGAAGGLGLRAEEIPHDLLQEAGRRRHRALAAVQTRGGVHTESRLCTEVKRRDVWRPECSVLEAVLDGFLRSMLLPLSLN